MATISEWFNLAVRYHQSGDPRQTEALCRQILEADPFHAAALQLLGISAHQAGRPEAAIDWLRRAIALNPADAGGHFNLGVVFLSERQHADAARCFRQALLIEPDDASAHYNLGNVLKNQGHLAEAVSCYRQALRVDPQHARALNNLGNALFEQGQAAEALECYRQALRINPHDADAHHNLGAGLFEQGELDEARECYRQALRLSPRHAEAHNNLGILLKDQGQLDEAIACFQSARELKPDNHPYHSAFLGTLHYHPRFDARAIFEEHNRWDLAHARSLTSPAGSFANDPCPERRLRIGYVSPDFSSHPVGRFMLPLLEAHDHERMEIYCYASVRVPDAVTDRCRAHADVWRDVLGLPDERLAQAICEDRIDVLVDLTAHAENNRLLAFARKPAPVQATYLAYCGTTGLSAMDYRLTDPYLDPPGQDEAFYAEESIRLPQTYWCYQPPPATPSVNRLPATDTSHVTFGCLNNFSKVTEPTLAAWRHLLKALPEARVLLHAKAGSHRDRVRDFMAQEGVAPQRITFVGKVAAPEYFRIYEHMDIALDPFPYGGGTTTCDALWMGVPVVSLAGQTAVGRGGLSILSNIGLADLVATSTEEYVDIAVRLAADLPRLAALRTGLRDRLRQSPLMDAAGFTRGVEQAYRSMWQRWCVGRQR